MTRAAAPRADELRWALAFALAASLHACAVVAVLATWRAAPEAGDLPLVVDLEPLAAAPSSESLESVPGPEQTQTGEVALAPPPQPAAPEAPPPEPVVEPPQPVAAPTEPALPAPREPVRDVEPPPPVTSPQPVQTPRHPERSPPTPGRAAPTTSPSAAAAASPRPAARAVGQGAGTATPGWNSRIVAHLQRHRRYPAEAQARGASGTARLVFTIDRSGRVLSSKLAGSSGEPSLDQETLALIRRAAPLPAAPPEVAGERFSFSIPIRYSLR